MGPPMIPGLQMTHDPQLGSKMNLTKQIRDGMVGGMAWIEN